MGQPFLGFSCSLHSSGPCLRDQKKLSISSGTQNHPRLEAPGPSGDLSLPLGLGDSMNQLHKGNRERAAELGVSGGPGYQKVLLSKAALHGMSPREPDECWPLPTQAVLVLQVMDSCVVRRAPACN